MLDSFSGAESELELSLLLVLLLLEEDLEEFFLCKDGKIWSSDSELLDEDDSAEEVSSISDSLLLDTIELVSVSRKGLYKRFNGQHNTSQKTFTKVNLDSEVCFDNIPQLNHSLHLAAQHSPCPIHPYQAD